jgi:predicted phage terminase large subunit-like protein
MLRTSIIAARALPLDLIVESWDALEAFGEKHGNKTAVVRELIKADLFYLLVRACKRVDLLHPWKYARVREVEANPNGYLDLWSREHGKSSTVTFGLTISDILNDPETTVGIFSHTRPIAKAFMRTIMRELESNKILHACFPDILWGEDVRQAPKWSEDDGIIVKRKTNPNEATVEAWGLVDGQPVSKHFRTLLYDDIVVQGSVTNPDQIAKTNTALEQSYNLGQTDGGNRRFCGTRWHFNDSYSMLLKRGSAKPRIYACTEDGTDTGTPVIWTKQQMEDKRRDMGPYTFSAQCLMNPRADETQGFKRDWLRFYKSVKPKQMNVYLLVDAASSKKRGSDFTAIWAVGLGQDGNYYALDMVRDRLNLKERSDRLFAMHRKWKPKQVRYERYGLMADVEHMKSRMEEENYRFTITEVAGVTSKVDRIKRLVPIFEQGKFWLPRSLHVTDWQKQTVDLVNAFVEEEYMAFPIPMHDDMLDALARICEPDLRLTWPTEEKVTYVSPPVERHNAQVAWMA